MIYFVSLTEIQLPFNTITCNIGTFLTAFFLTLIVQRLCLLQLEMVNNMKPYLYEYETKINQFICIITTWYNVTVTDIENVTADCKQFFTLIVTQKS